MSEADIANMEEPPLDKWVAAPEGVTRATVAIERVIIRDLCPHTKALLIQRDGHEIARAVLDRDASSALAARLTTVLKAAP